MKFGIREGFVVHQAKTVEVLVNGEKMKQRQENSFYPTQELDLSADEAEDHLHKLVPIDKEAKAYCDRRTAQVSTPVEGTGMNSDTLAQIVAAAVTQALAVQAAQQVQAQPPA